jgi:tetratricopeptide (TPR) repeat protein
VEPQVPAPREIPRAEDLRKTVLELFEASTTKDHFEFLRVERSATDAQIRDAWARLARVLHPDSWRNAALTDLHEIRDAVFVRLTEASKVLRDPGKRSRYEREHPPRFVEAPPAPDSTAAPAGDPPPGASRDEAPRGPSIGELVHKGEVLLKNEKYWEAIQILEPLIARAEGPTKARARVNLALAYLKNPHWVRRAEDLLLDVVRDRPQHAAAYLVLGRLYRGSGFPKRAACMYKKVLELEPEAAEAAQALAEIEAPSPARGPRRLRAILG